MKLKLTPWKGSYVQPSSILKSRDITLPTKVCLVKAMVFPVAMYRCESWTVKKAESQRTDAFELWCWRRLLRVRWTERRSNQSILKEISPECSLEDVKNLLIGKDSEAGKDWGWEEKGMTVDEIVGWHHRLNGHGFGWTLGVGDGQGGLACCGSWGRKESDTTEWLNWTELERHKEALGPNQLQVSLLVSIKVHSGVMLPYPLGLSTRFTSPSFICTHLKMTISFCSLFLRNA